MRRVRPSEPGGVVLFEPEKPDRGPVKVTSAEQIALDTDVRKLLDDVRVDLGDALRGKSTPQLEPTWSMTAIVGGPATSTTAIVLDNNTADAYLARVFDRIAEDVVAKTIDKWLDAAAPTEGDGVGTVPTPNTSGGPIPNNPR